MERWKKEKKRNLYNIAFIVRNIYIYISYKTARVVRLTPLLESQGRGHLFFVFFLEKNGSLYVSEDSELIWEFFFFRFRKFFYVPAQLNFFFQKKYSKNILKWFSIRFRWFWDDLSFFFFDFSDEILDFASPPQAIDLGSYIFKPSLSHNLDQDLQNVWSQ